MIELAWFAAGVATTVAATLLVRARRRTEQPHRVAEPPSAQISQRRGQEPALDSVPDAASPALTEPHTPAAPTEPQPVEPQPVEPPPAEPLPNEPQPAVAVLPPDARTLALSLAEELATLVCGVEGRAHGLIECAPHRVMLPPAAEALLLAIQRLRTLHKKLLAFGRNSVADTGTADLGQVVSSLTDELQHMQLGIEVRWDPPPTLPGIAAHPEVLREALLFLCSGLMRTERGATRLSIEAELCLAEELPVVQLELALEWVVERTGVRTELGTDLSFSIEHEAATNLIRGQGGAVTITHLPGRAARALVRLPAITALESTAAPDSHPDGEKGPAERHRYGGALVLEADPSIRAMLANELKATGRAVFACADGASARSFLAATPDRFELLIVDHPERLFGDDALGETIRSLAPGLKICVLGTSTGERPLPGSWPHLHRIDKPFGVHELRQALASVLAFG